MIGADCYYLVSIGGSMEIKKVTEDMAVSPQIQPDDIQAIKAAGYKVIVNNRPDGEMAGQPLSNEIEALAVDADIDYHYIPMIPGELTQDMIDELKEVLDNASGPVFAYCRSGTRSITLWSLCQAGKLPADEIIAAGSANGYDLDPMRPTIEALAAQLASTD